MSWFDDFSASVGGILDGVVSTAGETWRQTFEPEKEIDQTPVNGDSRLSGDNVDGGIGARVGGLSNKTVLYAGGAVLALVGIYLMTRKG